MPAGGGLTRPVDAAGQNLIVYGSLAPGGPNHHLLSPLEGSWTHGWVTGHLVEQGWGAELGYPALRWAADGPRVPAWLLQSPNLREHWDRLDELEGAEYRRILVPFHTEDEVAVGYLYAIASPQALPFVRPASSPSNHMSLEYWLEGPVEGVPPLLLPAAHGLIQAGVDLREAAGPLTPSQLWYRPNGAASVGFHLRHVAGSLDRLLTYARGEQLTQAQREVALSEAAEPAEPIPVARLLEDLDAAIQAALGALRATPESSLLERRLVGTAQRPSNVLGVLFHAAEHAQRHAGQVVTTARIVREGP